MIAERYSNEIHFSALVDWARTRGLPPIPAGLIPSMGRVVQGICAAFLYTTDSGIAFVENMISNPNVGQRIATKGLDLCVLALEEDAKTMGVSLLCASTYIPGVSERAERHGYKVMPRKHFRMTKELI